MDARELKIGNLVLRQNKPYPISFDDFAKHGLELACDYKIKPHLEELEPIPLTEEWLLKMGFYKSSGKNPHFMFGETMLIFRTEFESDCIENYYQFEFGITKSFKAIRQVKLEYVHQLQNLYFALTGQELNIKL